jgi:hypothetical protein
VKTAQTFPFKNMVRHILCQALDARQKALRFFEKPENKKSPEKLFEASYCLAVNATGAIAKRPIAAEASAGASAAAAFLKGSNTTIVMINGNRRS